MRLCDEASAQDKGARSKGISCSAGVVHFKQKSCGFSSKKRVVGIEAFFGSFRNCGPCACDSDL